MSIGVYILLFFILLGVVLKIRGNKIDRSKDEAVDFLKRMEEREVDAAGWDRFFNISIKDKHLDTIRKRCGVLWGYEDFLMQNEKGDFVLNDRGSYEVKELINELVQTNT